MKIRDILKVSRCIWGEERLSLPQIIVRLGKVFGDICFIQRSLEEEREASEKELKKELGNLVVSTIRWCDDLGFNPEECVVEAFEAQKKYVERLKKF